MEFADDTGFVKHTKAFDLIEKMVYAKKLMAGTGSSSPSAPSAPVVAAAAAMQM